MAYGKSNPSYDGFDLVAYYLYYYAMATQYTVCFVTVDSEKIAASIAEGLVEGRLAACVSTVDGVSSTYRWQGKLEKSKESLLIIKTRKTLAEDVEQFVKKNHPGTTPEVIFLDVAHGGKAYLDWLGANTLFTSNIPQDRLGKSDY